MHATTLQAWANISAKQIHIRYNKVSVEYEEHTGHVWAHNLTQVHKLVCAYAIFLLVLARISPNFDKIREIKVYVDL